MPISSCSWALARHGTPQRRPTSGKIVAIHDHPLKEHMVYQNLHADCYLEGDIAESLTLLIAAAKSAKIDDRRRERAAAALDPRARQLCCETACRAREGAERSASIRSRLLARSAR